MMCRKGNHWPNKTLYLFLLLFLRTILFFHVYICIRKLFMSHSKEKIFSRVQFGFHSHIWRIKRQIQHLCKPKNMPHKIFSCHIIKMSSLEIEASCGSGFSFCKDQLWILPYFGISNSSLYVLFIQLIWKNILYRNMYKITKF